MTKRIYTQTLLLLSLVLIYSCDKSESYSITDHYVACGWMGCGEMNMNSISLHESWKKGAQSGDKCIKVTFENCEERSGSGIYWINNKGENECNWGTRPGNDLSPKNFTTLSFWAKGEKGGERIKFGIGGVKVTNKLYKDSLDAPLFATLTTDWTEYTINVSKKNFSSVIGGFYWYSANTDNPNGATFYIDSVELK